MLFFASLLQVKTNAISDEDLSSFKFSITQYASDLNDYIKEESKKQKKKDDETDEIYTNKTLIKHCRKHIESEC